MSDEQKSHIEELRRLTPSKRKEVATLERLLKLAKQSPFASANQDFLDLQENVLEGKKMMVEVGEKILEAMDDKDKK